MRQVDKILTVALFLGLISCLYGIHWGRVEPWNPDQMAFISLFSKDKLPLNPGWFHKPPFYTYTVFFLSVVPIYGMGKILGLSEGSINHVMLIWSRLLMIFMFLGSIICVFFITKKFFSRLSARIIAIVFSTSAGFVAFAHFLTTDIPVMFWMLVAFYFSQRVYYEGNTADYALAGFFTGIATATKYNGLGVGIAIVASHVLSGNSRQWLKKFLSKKLYLGLFMVIVGFVMGNPFSILDYSTFISDFIYNYTVTPVYSGGVGEHGYWNFLSSFIDIVGIPSVVVFSIAIAVSLFALFFEKNQLWERKGMILLLIVFLLYYYKIGSFPRIPSRFVLPIVPFWLIISAPFWERIEPKKFLMGVLLSFLLTYNLICCYFVGKRFIDDPRMSAQKWVEANVREGSSIESSNYTPNWSKLSNVNLKETRMPVISGRRKLFEKKFEGNSFVLKKVQEVEKHDDEESWYTLERLMRRQPDYVAVNSLYYKRFVQGKAGEKYTALKKFFDELLEEKYPYTIVFDKVTKKNNRLLYPAEIDFLKNRMTILKSNNLMRKEIPNNVR